MSPTGTRLSSPRSLAVFKWPPYKYRNLRPVPGDSSRPSDRESRERAPAERKKTPPPQRPAAGLSTGRSGRPRWSSSAAARSRGSSTARCSARTPRSPGATAGRRRCSSSPPSSSSSSSSASTAPSAPGSPAPPPTATCPTRRRSSRRRSRPARTSSSSSPPATTSSGATAAAPASRDSSTPSGGTTPAGPSPQRRSRIPPFLPPLFPRHQFRQLPV